MYVLAGRPLCQLEKCHNTACVFAQSVPYCIHTRQETQCITSHNSNLTPSKWKLSTPAKQKSRLSTSASAPMLTLQRQEFLAIITISCSDCTQHHAKSFKHFSHNESSLRLTLRCIRCGIRTLLSGELSDCCSCYRCILVFHLTQLTQKVSNISHASCTNSSSFLLTKTVSPLSR